LKLTLVALADLPSEKHAELLRRVANASRPR
jgi:hypothetical protein